MINKTIILIILIGILIAGGYPTGVLAEKYKLVVQMSSNEERAQKRTLVRINQLLNALKGDEVVVEVVAIGPAFNLVANKAEKKLLSLGSEEEGKFVKEVKKLMKRGVIFTADVTIQKMMKMHKMSDELIEGVKVVKNGAAHILKLQSRGYQYQAMFF
jgi:intracellular sulfur oxidation DsrE/DsrF family protein